MIARLFGDRRRLAILRRVDRPLAIALAVAQALIAAAGWFADPIWLAVAVAGQLAVGGFVAVWVMGPARPDLGLARYAMPATAGLAATLAGRIIPGGLSLLLVPLVAVLLWSVTYLELRIERGSGGRTIGGLLLTTILFAAVVGLFDLFGLQTWPTPVVLVAAFAMPLALRAAEGRGTMGAEGFGQAMLHVLVVVQVGLAAVLLSISIYAAAGLVALAFYTWAGAVDALRGDASGRSVALEFGALMLVGLAFGVFLHQP
jgi:hypothetical protein